MVTAPVADLRAVIEGKRAQAFEPAFDALTKAFAIGAAAARKAQVEREGQHVVTDSSIVYADRTRTVNVSGNFRIVPGSSQAPIEGKGTANYNLAERSGRLTNAEVTVEEGGVELVGVHLRPPVLRADDRDLPADVLGEDERLAGGVRHRLHRQAASTRSLLSAVRRRRMARCRSWDARDSEMAMARPMLFRERDSM